MLRNFWFVLSFVSLVACNGGESESPASSSGSVSVSYAVIDSGSSAITSAQTQVIRDQSAYGELWARHVGDGLSSGAPTVDFNTRLVAAIFLGAAPNGCYSASVTQVTQSGQNAKVEYRLNVPPSDAMCTQAIVYPAVWISLPKLTGEVTFSRAK